ncbi:uncharacterized protein LOC130820829 isoform X1 [Amaranthus tricolor]|uniref:uncharacterized protein LOC130820829 isoform X1 n=1 Tax=Amaranthus tricolor TaxID=29722 RepID=UPI0025844DE6|nr:uncharacterized protein LOC130820829 isoform X1 [Amaranthus tricolor]
MLHSDPLVTAYVDAEVKAAESLKRAKQDYSIYMQQIGKVQWIKFGDENSRVFHQSIRQRRVTNIISSLHLELVSDPNLIQNVFISFYSDILCSSLKHRRRINMMVISTDPVLSASQREASPSPCLSRKLRMLYGVFLMIKLLVLMVIIASSIRLLSLLLVMI